MSNDVRYSVLTRLIFITLFIGVMLTACGAHVYHQVRKNDTLYSISWHYNQDFQQVAKWNGLSAPYTIREGQWLRVAPSGPTAGLSEKSERKTQTAMTSRNATSKAPTKSKLADSKSAPKSFASAQIKNWIWPVKGKVIQKFSADVPGKQGVDISAKAGTQVNAAAAGKVVYSGNGLRGYGNLIIIKHNEELLSAYAHNQSILVSEGDVVKQGQAIARIGNTESNQTKLHFQIRVNGKPVDPLRYLPK